jgi:hypothetical protein
VQLGKGHRGSAQPEANRHVNPGRERAVFRHFGHLAGFDVVPPSAHHRTNGETVMPSKAASTRVDAKVASKSVRRRDANPRAKKPRISKIEAERLAHFKALMEKYRGKATFAGFDA